jgi:hypothetical protein
MTAPTPWSRFVLPLQYAASDTGAPLAGGKLYFFATGTSEPLDTYADATLSTPNTNPVVADQAGVFPPIFLAQAQYKVMLTDSSDVEVYTADPVAPFVPTAFSVSGTVVVECVVDGNGQIPLTGICGDAYLPVGATLVAAVLQANEAGSLVVDVWAAPFVVNTPPGPGNSITASAPPTLDSSQSSIDTTLTGWDTALAAGTAVRFNLVSISTITRFTLTLVGTITAASA